jgi:hypothetical protein
MIIDADFDKKKRGFLSAIYNISKRHDKNNKTQKMKERKRRMVKKKQVN